MASRSSQHKACVDNLKIDRDKGPKEIPEKIQSKVLHMFFKELMFVNLK